MKDIRNTTVRPVRVPLPNKGVLHLGPRKSGQVADNALEHPPFKKLVDSGDLEVVGDGQGQLEHPFKQKSSRSGSQTVGNAPVARSTGDR